MAGRDMRCLTSRASGFLNSLRSSTLGGRHSVRKMFSFSLFQVKILQRLFLEKLNSTSFFQPAAILHPVMAMLKGLEETKSYKPPFYSSGGERVMYSGCVLKDVVWHPRRRSVAAISDAYGYLVIVDVQRDKTLSLIDDVSMNIKID